METPVLTHRFATRQAFLDHAKAENKAFFEANVGRVLVRYERPMRAEHDLIRAIFSLEPEPEGKRAPTAVFVAHKREDGTVRVGWSAANPDSPDTFSKTIGLWKAIRRATGEGRPAPKLPSRLSHFENFGLDAEYELKGRLED